MLQKNKILTALVLFPILFLSIIAAVVGYLVYDIENIGSKIKEQDQDILVLDERIAKAREFRAFRSQNESELAKVEKVLVFSEMPLEFINFLEDISKECQVVSSFSTTAVSKSKEGGWPFINFQVALTGNFSSAMMFLKKIESGPYLVEIGSLAVKNDENAELSEEGDARERKVKMDISIKAYAKK